MADQGQAAPDAADQGQAAPDALAHIHQRRLRDAAAAAAVQTVATAQEFQDAVASSADHIDLIGHLDLRGFPVQRLTTTGDKSIRGNCTEPVAFEDPLQGVSLRRGPGQCVIVAAPEGFVSVSGGGLWLDNVVVRQGEAVATASPPTLITVERNSRLWLTSAVVQGHGNDSSCSGVSSSSPFLSQDTTFADLGGNASVALIDGATASFINTTFERCEAAAPHALITARGAAAATWLEDVAVPGSDTPGGAFRSEAGAQFYASAALPAGVEVFDADAGAPTAPEVVPAQPAGTGFATESEAASIRGDPTAGVPVAEPGAAGDGGLSVAAIIGIVVAALIVVVAAVLLTTRRRRGHTFQRDAWGLPINPVGPARERAASAHDLPGRRNSSVSTGGHTQPPGSKAGAPSVVSAHAMSALSDGLTVSASAREGTTETNSSHALGGTGPFAHVPGAPPPPGAYVAAADGSVQPVPGQGGVYVPVQNPDAAPGAPHAVYQPPPGHSGQMGVAAGASYAGSSISLAMAPGGSGGLHQAPVVMQAPVIVPAPGGHPGGFDGRGGVHPQYVGAGYVSAAQVGPQGSAPLQTGPLAAAANYAQGGWGGGGGVGGDSHPGLTAGQGWSGPQLSQPLASGTVATAAAFGPGSSASLAGAGRWASLPSGSDPSRTLEPTTMGTTGALLPPGVGASAEDMMNFVEMQLDSIGDAPVLAGFVMLGPQERRRGGQAVIQFARRQRGREEVAFKFFVSRADYAAEVDLYRNDALGDFLPMAEAYVDNADRALCDAYGNPLPPCIVMERGDTLHDRLRIALTDKAGTAQVLVNIAMRLGSLHTAGWVHRDLKPGNVLWLSRKQRWTLIDFGLAARTGADVAASFTPMYAAPEVVRAYKLGSGRITADPAQDAWALGVMAFELLTGKPAFDKFEGHATVYAQLLGEAELPWEGGRLTLEVQRQLGVFRRPVLQLLAREPGDRISLRQFARDCESIFDSPSLVNTAPAAPDAPDAPAL